MKPITSVDELKNTIQLLEFELEVKERLLREQVYLTYESLKPANLIRKTMSDISSSPYLLKNILGTAAGLVSGYISKKLATGKSGNLVRNILGTILQFGITNTVARHFLKR